MPNILVQGLSADPLNVITATLTLDTQEICTRWVTFSTSLGAANMADANWYGCINAEVDNDTAVSTNYALSNKSTTGFTLTHARATATVIDVIAIGRKA